MRQWKKGKRNGGRSFQGNGRGFQATIEAMEPRRLLSTYTVNTLSDAVNAGTGLLTLRQAVSDANAHAGADTIAFDSAVFAASNSHTITLTQGAIVFADTTGTTTVTGPGSGALSINANQLSRVFQISSGSTVSLSGLTITGGVVASAPGVPAIGGGILTAGTLDLTNVTVSNNTAIGGDNTGDDGSGGSASGGGIYSTGTLSVVNSVITGNTSQGGSTYASFFTGSGGASIGGGIFSGTSTTIAGSTVSQNVADGGTSLQTDIDGGIAGVADGGGIYAMGSLLLSSSSISQNAAQGGVGLQMRAAEDSGAVANGGGVYASGSSIFTTDNFNGNYADGGADSGLGGSPGSASGGAIYSAGSTSLTASTLSGNSAEGGNGAYDDNGPGADAFGGAIASSAPLAIFDSTLTSNSVQGGQGAAEVPTTGSSAYGGGVYSTQSLSINNSTVSGNRAAAGQGAPGDTYGASGGTAAGAGVFAGGNSSISNSTISTNVANGGYGESPYLSGVAGTGGPGEGAGVYNVGSLTITNSTLTANSAEGGDAAGSFHGTGGNGGDGSGSAIFSTGALTVDDSTISGNSTNGGTGGMSAEGYPNGSPGNGLAAVTISSGSAVFNNSILSGNTASGSVEDDVQGSAKPTSGGNLIGVGGGLTNGVNDNQVGVNNPKLAALADNGGPTQTMLPQPGSPAIDSGDNALVPAQLVGDQRVAARIFNSTVDIGAVETGAPVPLSGTVIGTVGSYASSGNVAANAFDGNLSTYFDGPSSSNDYTGLDLGAPAVISQISYAPRSGYASRMVGGVFQGSNSADFSTGLITLYTITTAPTVGVLTTVSNSNTTAFRYVRYLGPSGGYCNIAEAQFFSPVSAVSELSGTVIGTAGSYASSGNTIAKVFDGNLSTFFDANQASGAWAGLDLGAPTVIAQISYAPRSGYASRMVGGMFQGSNTANFSSGVVTLYTVTTAPTAGVLTTVSISNSSAFRYVRYLGPNGGYCDISEAQFFGASAPFASVDSNGNLIVTGTAGSDTITVTFNTDQTDSGNSGSFSVTENGATETVDAAGVKQLVINTLDGADSVTVTGQEQYDGTAIAPAPVNVSITSGAGNDRVMVLLTEYGFTNSGFQGAIGPSTFVNAGDGNDGVTIQGGSVASIQLGNGNDGISTAAGGDDLTVTMIAGNGNDVLSAGSAGDAGQEVSMTAGTGQDEFFNGDVDDHVDVSAAGASFSLDSDQGAVSGKVYTDTNGDGVYETGEPTVANAQVYLDNNDNGIFDAGDTAVVTDANGNYVIAGLTPSSDAGTTSYHVAVTPPSGTASSTASDGAFTVTLSPGEGASGFNFGLKASSSTAPLTGTVIGTPGSYASSGNTIAKVFDGSLATFFDSNSASGSWAGLDLGTPTVITKISYAPRSGFASRMVGGMFQGSNTASFSSGVTTLYTITTMPVVGSLTTVSISNTTAFRYVRYLGPTGGYCDIAEAQFFSSIRSISKFTGTVIGSSGSYSNSGNTITNVFDENLNTFYDAAHASNDWVGLDLGTAQVVTQVQYAPRSGWAARMVGGMFQASNTANFSSGVVTLYTISSTPAVGTLTVQPVSNTAAYRYYRYIGPTNGYCNISELEFDG